MKNKEAEIQMECVILNGQPHHTTIDDYANKGWQVIGVRRAKDYHPYACETDTILFVAKPINKEIYDAEMDERRRSQPNNGNGKVLASDYLEKCRQLDEAIGLLKYIAEFANVPTGGTDVNVQELGEDARDFLQRIGGGPPSDTSASSDR